MRLSDAGVRRQTKAVYPDHPTPSMANEDATRDRSNRLLDDCANGDFALSKIAPSKDSNYYSQRRRDQRAKNNSYAKNHPQNVGPAVGTTRDTDVHEGICDHRQ